MRGAEPTFRPHCRASSSRCSDRTNFGFQLVAHAAVGTIPEGHGERHSRPPVRVLAPEDLGQAVPEVPVDALGSEDLVPDLDLCPRALAREAVAPDSTEEIQRREGIPTGLVEAGTVRGNVLLQGPELPVLRDRDAHQLIGRHDREVMRRLVDRMEQRFLAGGSRADQARERIARVPEAFLSIEERLPLLGEEHAGVGNVGRARNTDPAPGLRLLEQSLGPLGDDALHREVAPGRVQFPIERFDLRPDRQTRLVQPRLRGLEPALRREERSFLPDTEPVQQRLDDQHLAERGVLR